MGKKIEYARCEICGQRFMEYFGCESNGQCLCKECNEVVGEEFNRQYQKAKEKKRGKRE